MRRLHAHPGSLDQPGPIRLEGDEAHHALRVRRLREGDRVELIDGAGTVLPGRVAAADGRGRWIEIEPAGPAARVEPVRPRLEVCSAAPKGDRLGAMIDQLSQLGAASWRPLNSARSVVDPREAKLDRLRRVAIESAKQCGRAWVLEIGDAVSLEQALDAPGSTRVLVCDAGGAGAPTDPPEAVRLIVGPEGGLSDEELELAGQRGATAVRLGPHTMRIEAAAAAAAAILMRDATSPAPRGYTSQEVET